MIHDTLYRAFVPPTTQALAFLAVFVYATQAIAFEWIQGFSHKPSGRLPLLSIRSAVTFPAEDRHCPLASTKLYCLVTEAHMCQRLVQGLLHEGRWTGLELIDRESNVLTITLPHHIKTKLNAR